MGKTVRQVREQLVGTPRLLMQVELKPVQGDRFQATGFPDIGPATYIRPDGTEMLLVESSQSMANRLEEVCWDFTAQDVVGPLRGMPYVKVHLGNGRTTNSILEAHRLNSPYILESSEKSFLNRLMEELSIAEKGPVDNRLLASVAFKYDPNSIIHGVFLAREELAGGRFRLKRCLSSFIEAENVRIAESGGVKIDIVDPSGKTMLKKKGEEENGEITRRGSKEGYGNIPYHRVEFVAEKIIAYFNLDTDLLFSYGLGEVAEEFLLTLSLWKIRRFLDRGTRLRTACDLLPMGDLEVTQPSEFKIPSLEELGKSLPGLVDECRKQGLFADPPVTEMNWT